ncbi:MAG: VWA domain-containing protein [Planctomycetota bacterium]|nr:MAG: VWA domain-containing protein [Planctomycetota bacterium]
MKKLSGIFVLLALFVIFTGPKAAKVYGGPEGKIDKEIDLPIEKPKIKDIPEDEDDGPEFYGEDLSSDSDSLVFVVDFSCSMSGSRIAKAKAEVAKAINGLTKNFKFSVVTFSCDIMVWSQQLKDATDTNKAAAAGWVSSQSTRGATGTGVAVKTALKLDTKNKLVVLLTDGAPNCLGSNYWATSNDHLNMIMSSNSQKAKIDVFAIQPWSGSYRSFCQKIAQQTGGKYKEVN